MIVLNQTSKEVIPFNFNPSKRKQLKSNQILIKANAVILDHRKEIIFNYPLDFPRGISILDYIHKKKQFPIYIEFGKVKKIAKNEEELAQIEDEFLESLNACIEGKPA